jgi:predicted AlkP superfamily pyrophosphatase or phosphodiesterase
VKRVICFIAWVVAVTAFAAPDKSLLLISLDGVKPEYIANADEHQLKIPHLRRLWAEGARAAGVRGVLPTSTYPSHTTLVTGVAPARHGIGANQPFDPADVQPTRWYWYNEDMHVPALWDAATAAGYEVGSVSWPVTVGARGIKYNIPDFTGTRSDEDAKMIRAWAGVEFVEGLAKNAGPLLTDISLGTARDWARLRYLREIVRQKKPRVLLAHFVASDFFQHQHGPFSQEAFAAIEEIDDMVGQLVAEMREVYPDAAICLVSDHGFSRIEQQLALDAVFVRAGLITLESAGGSIAASKLKDWVAMPWPSGGSAAIVLKNRADQGARRRVLDVLTELAAEPANGVARILGREEIAELGGSSDADFWVDLKPGTAFTPLLGAWTRIAAGRAGTHGFVPTHDEMHALFVLAGPGIKRGDMGEIDMRSIAPTLARHLGASLLSAELPPLDILESQP